MYNLIFVDDEKRVLDAVREIIPWEELNVQVVGMCDNAISALQLMINEHTDILVTDIKMPVMDGLELINRAKEMYPGIECIILSGHEEFELAREAIARGIRSYLVKPCSKEELMESIQSCVKYIDRSRGIAQINFEERQHQIEQTYDRLMGLQLSGMSVDEQLSKVNACTQDYGILREAAIMAVIQHEQSAQKLHPVMKKLTRTQDSHELVQLTLEILHETADEHHVEDPVVARSIQYVYDHYSMPSLTLQYMADDEIHLTARYIGRRFLNAMNMKFSDFLLQVRMEKAMELLRKTDVSSATEIAGKVGLGNNVQYFYRLFRQYTGMTLKEYKDKYAGVEND